MRLQGIELWCLCISILLLWKKELIHNIFFPDNNSLCAVNSKNLNRLQLCEPHVLFLSFLPSGPFRMRDFREMDNILSNLKAYGAEQDSSEGSWFYNPTFISN